VIDQLLPDALRGGEPGGRDQVRMLAIVLLIVFGIATAILIGRGTPEQPILLGFAGSVLVCTSGLIVGLRVGAPVGAIGTATLGMIYCGSMGLVFASGGEAFPAAMMASLLPMIAYSIQGRRAAIGWSGAVFAGIVGASIYARTATSFPYRGELLGWEHWRFESFGLMLFFMFVAALAIDWVVEAAKSETAHVQDQMRSQDARYRDLVQNIGDVMMEYTASADCVYVSPHSLEVFGRAPEELLGGGYRDFIHPDDIAVFIEAGASAAASPGRTVNRNLRFLHVSGDWIEGEVSGRSFYADDGELHFVSIFRDLSELYRAERAVRHSDRLASAGTLAAGIAHQINNPIGSIRNAAEYALICAKDGSFDEVEEVLQSNIEQAARCGEIVRSLLLFASREPREKQRADVRGVVQRACALAGSYAGERGVEVVVSCADETLDVDMSSIEIEQVLLNLVRNAIESKPRSRRVEVDAERDGDRVRIEVRDDGRGITPADLDQVFDPFFTTRLEEGGSGLGLSVALGIAREHGGDLELESTAGVGSRATLELPAARS